MDETGAEVGIEVDFCKNVAIEIVVLIEMIILENWDQNNE